MGKSGTGHRPKALYQICKVLWHLDIFRRSFRDLSGHACMAESCIFCALKELFSQLQFSHETALPPDALRRALAESFFDQQRFQLGFMDDAAECFENMLLRIHTHIAHGEAEDLCNVRHCIPHQKFAMCLVEQSVCGACEASSEPLSYTQMVHYVSASALTTQVRMSISSNNIGIQDSFGMLLRKAGSMGDIRNCPSSCGAKIQIQRSLVNHPEIVSIGIVWDSERPTLEHIMDVFATVGTTLRLTEVFGGNVDNRWADKTTHNLVGVVTYYGKHYSTFFFHTKLRVWIYFDDATVREVGPRWEQVVEKCRKGRYQPLLLLYAVPGGTPVSTEDAPKQIVPFQQTAKKPPVPEYQNLNVIQDGINKKLQRSLSNSSSNTDSIVCNIKRRDSGNWSGDRNSASSASSTTMENPYLYLVGKTGNTDAGYDSYSISSNDSSTMSTIQNLMKLNNPTMEKIPEISCDVLCDEAEALLNKSRQLEDEHDLVLALALCNAATTKARAALNAPYNNPQTLTLARMKHNTCIMRARSLHRRMNASSQSNDNSNNVEIIRHTREGSSSGSVGRHSRQNSKESKATTPTNIEIYATLPKSKKNNSATLSYLSSSNTNKIEDAEYMLNEPQTTKRESRSIFSRRSKDTKRSRSEDRNKINSNEFSIAPEKQQQPKDNKKQHKIRRKLLMGGLIKRKNRSMPDLTEAANNPQLSEETNTSSSGYISESSSNLERSKLMRKNFHTPIKVPPPPPPQRTSSQLTTRAEIHQEPLNNIDDSGVDEVDCCLPSLPDELPPYPSPPSSSIHSRQQSNEEFPPPPPELINPQPTEESNNSVKNLASRFENQLKIELKEVEKINQQLIKSFKPPNGKKSVSFCDQVILVATAEEQEDDSYIPNPILERVLRSAIHKPEAAAIRQEILSLRDIESKKEEQGDKKIPIPSTPQMYHKVRRNSLDNLLSKPGMATSLSREEREYIMQNNQQIYGSSPRKNSVYQSVPMNSASYQNNGSAYQGVPATNTTYQTAPNNNYQGVSPTSTYQGIPANSPSYQNGANYQSAPASTYQAVSTSTYQGVPANTYQTAGNYQCANTSTYQGVPPNNYQSVPTSTYQPTATYQGIPANSPSHPAAASNYQGIPANSPSYQTTSNSAYQSVPANSPSYQNGVNTTYQSVNYQGVPANSPSYQNSNYHGIPANSPSYPNSSYQYPPSETNPNYPPRSTPSYPAYQQPAYNQYQTIPNNSPVYQQYYHTQPPCYQHPPSPSPSSTSSTPTPTTHQSYQYQRVPPQRQYSSEYPQNNNYYPQQHSQLPPLPPSAKHGNLKKSVSFEPGTKGEIFCNLCRKKAANNGTYCTDCDYYMLRFKPKS